MEEHPYFRKQIWEAQMDNWLKQKSKFKTVSCPLGNPTQNVVLLVTKDKCIDDVE